MSVTHISIKISTQGQGLLEVTDQILSALQDLPESGMLVIFMQHTSASLLIQENADPTAQADLETFLEKVAPEGESWHQHTIEGPDDTVSHLRSAITATTLQIPIINGKLALGTWQGIYLWEHRRAHKQRTLVLSLMS